MRTIAFLALLLAASVVQAEKPHTGWYVFGGAGMVRSESETSQVANDAALVAQGFNVIASTEDGGAAALLLGVGYRLSRHIALEGGYADLSELHRYSGNFTLAPNAGNSSKRWSASGYDLSLVGSLPVTSSISLIGKAGVYSMEGQFTESTLIIAPNGSVVSSTSASRSGSGTVPVFGIGAAIAIAKEFTVRAMIQRIGSKSGMFGAGNDLDRIDLFSLSFAYQI